MALILFTCDENGNGTMSLDGGAPFVFNGSLQPDPSWAGNPLRLTWDLASIGASPVGRGDVNILEPDDFTLSDVLRFTDAAGSVQIGLYADRMVLYSNLGGGKLADTGFPPNLNSGVIEYTDETPADTWEFIASGGNTYRGISSSDPTP